MKKKSKKKRPTKDKKIEKQILAGAYRLFGYRDPFVPLRMEQTFTVLSTRIYLDTLPKEEQAKLLKTFTDYNRAKEWYYNRKYDEKFLGKKFEQPTKKLKEYFRSVLGVNPMDYYATSIQSCVGGMISSQIEFLKLQEEEHRIRQENRKEKLENINKELDKKRGIKAALADFCKSGGKVPDTISLPDYGISIYVYEKKGKREVCISVKGKKDRYDSFYNYECWIDRRIRRLKSQAGMVGDKIMRGEQKQFKVPRRATFGGLAQYRKKDTVEMDEKEREQWHRERKEKRESRINFSGRHTSKDGNFQCRYDPDKHTVEVDLMDRSTATFQDIYFPYRGDELENYIRGRCGSVGYALQRKRDAKGREYLVIAATITVENTRVNSYFGDGCIAFDTNADCLAWARINSDGCCMEYGTIPFNLEGLNPKQREAEIAKALKELIGMCEKYHLPLAMEDLDFIRKKAAMEYKGKKHNRILALFAYRTVTGLAESQCFRSDILLCKVSPAYTSFIAKVKYMHRLGSSIHCAAAYVIGRRAMGLNEKVPVYLRPLLGDYKDRQAGYWAGLKKKIGDVKPSGFRRNIPELYEENKVPATV